MRRLLAALGLLGIAALSGQSAGAQEDGYTRAEWTDPSPTGERDGTPLAYLDSPRPLTGIVVHRNGVSRVTAVLVPDPSDPPPDGCDGTVEPEASIAEDGATFQVEAAFPCNLVYEIRATAQSNPEAGMTSGGVETRSMPLLVAVAIPPASVSSVDAILEIDDDDLTVTLEWPAGQEPDLLGYVVNRSIGGETETLGQVDAAEHPTFIDEDPPAGAEIRYDVIAVREGPDDDVEQVAASPASVTVDVPNPEEEEPAGPDGADGTGGDGETDPQLAGDATPTDGGAAPAPGSLSSVRIRGAPAPQTTPTTLDTGFSETIDYGEGGEAAGPPGDDAVVAIYDEGTSGSPWSDEETMTFVAGGLAVLSGAGTILTVTRRAARAAY